MANKEWVTCQGMLELLPVPVSLRHLQERVTRRPDFPKAYRLGAKRWWKRSEIIDWFETRRDA